MNRWNGHVWQTPLAPHTGPERQKEDIPSDILDKEETAVCPQAAAGPAVQHVTTGIRKGADGLAENFKVTAQAAATASDAWSDPAIRPNPRELTQKLADRHGTPLSFWLILYQFPFIHAKGTQSGTLSERHVTRPGRSVCLPPGGFMQAAVRRKVPASCRF